ncbi:MAG: sigma-70 family RNA polymerase sigma factor [Actinomycetota bacterium]
MERTPAGRGRSRLGPSNFDTFYEAHRDEVGMALGFTLGDQALGEEAVDEAMIRAYQRWDSVGGYESPAGWVYRTGLNWARSWHRSTRRRRRRERLVSASASAGVVPAAGQRVELVDALEQLSVDHRAVVVLRYFCDWPVADAAAALKVSEGTIKSRTARALDQLRLVLDDGSEHAS